MEKYEFFYDESEHSRKINEKTITAENYYDNFITAIIGWNLKDRKEQEHKYLAFEKKYQLRQSNGELKSSTISNKQLKFGFASLSSDNVEFISDYLELFDAKTFFYFSVTSKIEYVVNQLFQDYQSNLFENIEAMKYSIIKIIILYKPQRVIKGMYQDTKELTELLKSFFEERIEINKSNPELKEQENQAFEQILLLLNDLKGSFEIEWEYRIAFSGFLKYVQEKSITDFSLYTDKEGQENKTVLAAQNVGISQVEEIDSMESFGIRWADMLAGLLNKLLKALHNELAYISEEDGVNKKILSQNWFNLSVEQLGLYKKLAFIVSELNNAWYKSYAGIYSDDLLTLVTFLNFISQFSTVLELETSNQELLLPEQFNSLMVMRLQEYFAKMQFGSPVEPTLIIEENKEFYLGSRGQKIFFDENKQPRLTLKKDSQIFEVLAVGMSKKMIPNITVFENNEVICYRIPQNLVDWALQCIMLANSGMKIFPSKVQFTKQGELYFVDIL
ncbi:TPA: hypothetical protein ACN1ND_000299 [Enterococcus faecalis]|nr:hypothetical protein [Enterococcus faecalis]EKQ3613547.1 hypothetical protein [Enterococcus faecalis]